MDIISTLKDKNGLVFNEEQIKIINHFNGPAVVNSTAGSGKTTIICAKIGALINEYDIKPEKILVLTYSNASVEDISNRFKDLMISKIHINDIEKVKFTTIHSFALSVISYYSYKTNIKFNILGNEQKSVIIKIYREINNREPSEIELEKIINLLTFINNNKLDSHVNISGITLVDSFSSIYKRYEEIKKEENLVDYDDMIYVAYKLLKENFALNKYFSEKYQYILVDEAQDISGVQYEFIKQIVNFFGNIMFVGDSDQTIYSFRGSRPEILEKFGDDFSYSNKFYLDVNYRSSKDIVEKSKKFIEKSNKRFTKEIKANSNKNGNIYINQFNNEDEQYKFVIKEIMDKHMSELDETAILFRDSLSIIKPTCYLINKGVKFYSNIGEFRFFRHFTKNDIIAIILLADDKTLLRAFYQVYNKMGLLLKRQDIIKIRDEQLNGEDIFTTFRRLRGFTNEQRNLMNRFEEHLDEIVKMKPFNAIDYILENMEYKNYLSRLSKNVDYQNSIYYRYIDIMRFLTKNEPSIKTYWTWVGRLQLKIRESVINKNREAITLSTLHSSKGLEFKNVFIIDINDGILPTYMSEINNKSFFNNHDLDEERRLMYVGMTRAKENLYLLSSGKKSPFISEIEEIIE
ncbi:ATP-dependent helicase [Anaerosalibacter sp. Marseille-P3206]|uniref:ATP-dependent helicase n=1 Tax=Anaerosalibacter sp. Marseille-P3206 TaxID=1871005 RepID=UPI000986BCA8|nr:ATP-dependent helicase [Anaerosalibacter sp. Marseille-P3206]